MTSRQDIPKWAIFVLLLPLAPFLFAINRYWFPDAGAAFNDLTITHIPNLLYLKTALFEYGVVPLWSPTILSGYPFAANPLSGLWYPPGWLAVLLPVPMGFNVLALIHLCFGGAGMVLFLRRKGINIYAALFGAVVFEAMPKLFAHLFAGHITLLFAIAWTPWLLIAEEQRGQHRFLKPGVVMGVIFLADPRWAAYAGILWFAYAAHSQYMGAGVHGQKFLSRFAKLFSRPFLISILTTAFIAFSFSAPLLLPMLEYTSLSTRASLSPSEAFTFSLPPARLFGLFFPGLAGSHEWTVYFGASTLFLIAVGYTSKVVRSKTQFWGWVALLALLFSLGENLPGLTLFARLPGISLLRVPPRAIFLAGFAAAVICAIVVDAWLQDNLPAKRTVKMIAVGWASFLLILVAGIGILTRSLPWNFLWGAVAAWAAVFWVASNLGGQRPVWVRGIVLLGILLIDLTGSNLQAFAPVPVSTIENQKSETIALLSRQPKPYRVYSPSFSIPQHLGAQEGLELVDGVDPLQLSAYAVFLETASGVPRSGYSITAPPLNGPLESANGAYEPDAAALGLLNAQFVVSEYALEVEGLVLRENINGTRVYENVRSLPRAWLQPVNAPLGEAAHAVEVKWSPNTVALRAVGPGLLVLSEIDYPGWNAAVDGEKTEILAADGLLRSVELGSGEHLVEFVFRPVWLYVGIIFSLFGFLSLFFPSRKSYS